MGQSGIERYVQQHVKCPACGASMQLVRHGGYGYFYLKCDSCGDTEELETSIVDAFIADSQTRCPACGGKLAAEAGTFGVFVRCETGHISRVVDV